MSNKRVAQLLEARGILPAEQENFLHPDFARDTHDPLLMKDMGKAVARILAAIRAGERVGVFGDYDADGVPATALLIRCLAKAGLQALPFIPTREAGYGLSPEAVAMLMEAKLSLLITIDNGTVSKEEIDQLQAAGTDVIVCDHHQAQEGHIASPHALLNPKQPGCEYPFKELCACAIGWKLMSALYAAMGKDVSSLKWELDLVGLSTIADMVPLVGENRVLASYGLQVMRKSRNKGLAALIGVSGSDMATLSAGSVGFRLAPRINAPSRMHSETVEGENAALRLLITEDAAEADSLATYLNVQNQERQELLEHHLREAESLAEGLLADHCLVVYRPDWSTGVIGLLAGRLVEKHGRPVVVLAKEGTQIKGSVRSVDGIDAVSLIAAGEELTERYGGHAKAGGLTLLAINPDSEAETVERFRRLLAEWTVSQGLTLDELATAARRKPDMELALKEADLALAEELELLQPFGIGFPSPLFAAEGIVSAVRRVGKESQHLSFMLTQDGVMRKAIAFSQGGLEVDNGQHCRIEFSLAVEEWQGRRSVGLQVQRLAAQ